MPKEQKQMTDEEAKAQFLLEYDTICKKYGYTIRLEPYWRMERDGSYVMLINRYPAKVENGR